MKAKTRMFGEIDIQEDKIITLESGMIGFPDMQKFTLIFDEEKGSKSHIMWLQSMDDPQTAFPVINPVTIKEDYNPSVSEELLKPVGRYETGRHLCTHNRQSPKGYSGYVDQPESSHYYQYVQQ